MDCPLFIIRGKTKTGEVYFSRACTAEMCQTMRGDHTQDDVLFYLTFHKEPKADSIKAGGLPAVLYRDWLNKTKMAEAPKLW